MHNINKNQIIMFSALIQDIFDENSKVILEILFDYQ